MNDNIKPELIRLMGIKDEKVADDIIAYAKTLTAQDRKLNDFALAKELNERTTKIIDIVSDAIKNGIYASDIDTKQVNKSYILLVNALKQIYNRNQELTDIKALPIWYYIDIIEDNEYEIYNHIWERQNDAGQQHNAQINKLCIINKQEKPNYPSELKHIVDEADSAINDYSNQLSAKHKKVTEIRDWFIPEYNLIYALDGSILVNDVLKLKKIHAGSISDRLMEQAIKQPNTLFKPDLGQTARNISTTLSSMGFSGTLRLLFFPTVSKSKGILFRPTVKRTTADKEHIDTADLDLQLKELGVAIQLDPSSIPF